MTAPLTYLAWTLLLAMAQIGLAAGFKRQQDGLEWAAGNRDGEQKTYTGTAARLARAQSNLFETLPVFIGLVLLAHAAGRDGATATWGAALYFWSRLLYVPAYAFGLGPIRTLIWGIGIVGLAILFVAVL